MIIKTRRFGEIDISEDKIITFKEGLPGLEYLKKFIIIILEQTKPFYWLQAVEDDVSLPVISPFDIDKDYSPIIDDVVFEDLELEDEKDLLVLSVAVIPSDINKMTANMAAPILINIAKNIGKQIIIEEGDYQIRQPIFEAVFKKIEGGKSYAGSDEKA